MTTTLEDEVKMVVQKFMQNNELFTALDVSNKVKMTFPFARHRVVRDVVRGLFTTDMEPESWARSPISVVLTDGSTAEALLYHPLSDSWDLDDKYDAQKRSQSAVDTSKVGGVPAVTAQAASVAPTASSSTKDLWSNLFNNSPSLFPLK